MELAKPKDNLSYTIGDVTFLIRAQATVEDKLELDLSGDWQKDGTFKLSPTTYYKKLIERFVVDWQGVTDNGKPADYSFARLTALPADATKDWMLKLGTFIAGNTGIMTAAEEPQKNG